MTVALPTGVGFVFLVADAVLMYWLSVRVFRRTPVGILAVLALLSTPVLLARAFTISNAWLLLLTLWWAVSMTALLDPPTPGGRWMLAGGFAALPLGAIGDPSVLVMLPLWIAVTVAMFQHSEDWRVRDAIPSGWALLIGLSLQTVASLGATAHRLRLDLDAASHMFVAEQALGQWWTFFRPSHLFFDPQAPAFLGAFLTPMAVPIAVSIRNSYRKRATQLRRVDRMRPAIVAGCLGAPLAAALCRDLTDERALFLAPFALLLAVDGATLMWAKGRRLMRAGLVVLGVLTVIQVGAFVTPRVSRHSTSHTARRL